MDLNTGALGTEGKYDISIDGTTLVAEVSFADPLVGADLKVSLPLVAILEAIKVALPSTVTNIAVSGLEELLSLYTAGK